MSVTMKGERPVDELIYYNVTRGGPPAHLTPKNMVRKAMSRALKKRGDQLGPYTGGILGPRGVREQLAKLHHINNIDSICLANGSMYLFKWVLEARLEIKRKKEGKKAFITIALPHVCFDRAIGVIRQINETCPGAIKIVIIPEEWDGPNIEILTEKAQQGLDFMYAVPTFQNPLGGCWSIEKRITVVELAKKEGFIVIDDDPYGLLYYGEKPPKRLFTVAQRDPNVVIPLRSVSKVFNLAGFRFGYGFFPTWFIDFMLKSQMSPGKIFISQSVFTSLAVEQMLLDNPRVFIDQSKRLIKVFRPIMSTFVGQLQKHLSDYVKLHAVPGGGYFLWLKIIDQKWNTNRLIQKAERYSITLQAGSTFYPDPQMDGADRSLRLAITPFGSKKSVKDFTQRLLYVFGY